MNNTLDRTGECCPACGEGHLTSCTEETVYSYKRHEKLLPLHFSVCNHCGSELVGQAESVANKRAAIAFRRYADEPQT